MQAAESTPEKRHGLVLRDASLRRSRSKNGVASPAYGSSA